MPVEKTVLDNGLTIVSESMPWVRSVTMGFWYRVGSRDERPDQAGLAHFMEHMMFKGTPTMSALEVSEAFDALGAESNAFTSKECTCFYARFVDERLDDVLPLLADMVVYSSFRDEDIVTEREVVVEEIARSEDQPDDHVFELYMGELMPTHPLGRPVLGQRELVRAYQHADCRAFHDEHYHSGNLVVAAVGNIDHGRLVKKVQHALSGVRVGERRVRVKAVEAGRRSFVAQKRDIEQAHIVYGFPWYAAGDPFRFAGTTLAAILGGSMSSRLFQEVREKNGLAYTVMAGSNAYSDAGQFYVYCGTRPENLGKAMAIIRRELARIAEEPPTPEEVKRSCEVICGQLLLGVESTSDRMARIGRRETLGLPQTGVSELIERYRSVTPEDVRAVAERYLTASPTAAVISPYGEDEARSLVMG
ncbi:MAG: insulinase family protein [Coriobacteriaceae bacterium]|nr:insulinase family protein [Coriobacteriaceae bacterium]